jgi:serine/threonine protein kinase
LRRNIATCSDQNYFKEKSKEDDRQYNNVNISNQREIKLLHRLKHINIVTLVDVFAKVEDKEGRPGVFPWFETIEQEPLVWMFEDGTEEERYCKILKWYIILEFCPCSLQTILDHAPNNKIPMANTHE